MKARAYQTQGDDTGRGCAGPRPCWSRPRTWRRSVVRSADSQSGDCDAWSPALRRSVRWKAPWGRGDFRQPRRKEKLILQLREGLMALDLCVVCEAEGGRGQHHRPSCTHQQFHNGLLGSLELFRGSPALAPRIAPRGEITGKFARAPSGARPACLRRIEDGRGRPFIGPKTTQIVALAAGTLCFSAQIRCAEWYMEIAMNSHSRRTVTILFLL